MEATTKDERFKALYGDVKLDLKSIKRHDGHLMSLLTAVGRVRHLRLKDRKSQIHRRAFESDVVSFCQDIDSFRDAPASVGLHEKPYPYCTQRKFLLNTYANILQKHADVFLYPKLSLVPDEKEWAHAMVFAVQHELEAVQARLWAERKSVGPDEELKKAVAGLKQGLKRVYCCLGCEKPEDQKEVERKRPRHV
jgi:hypothetical protein